MKERQQSATKQGLYGILWNLSGSIIQILSQLLVIGILARLLTPEEFGIVAVIMILVTFSNLFTHLGIGSALIQLPKISPQHISLGYTLSIVIGLIIGIIFYLVAPLASTFFEVEEATNAFRFFAIFFPLRSFNSIAYALLSRKLKFSIIVKTGVVSYILGIGLTSIILAYLDFSYWALIMGQFAGLLITVSVMMYYEPPSFSFRFDKTVVKELLYFGSGHTLGTVFNYFAENADNIIVGKSLGTVALGIYSKAFQLLSIPSSFFGSIFDKVLFPILAQKQEEKEKLSTFYLFSTSLCFGVLIPVSVLIFINAELIVDFLLGDQWKEVVLPMQLLILGMAFRFGTKINKSFLKSMGLIYRGAYYQFIFAVMMFVACFLGGLWYGIPGVAAGVFLATILNYIQVLYRIYIHLGFTMKPLLNVIAKTTLLHLPFIGLTLVLYQFGVTGKWGHLLLSVLLYIPLMAYILFHRRYIVFSEDNFNLISQILGAFPTAVQERLRKLPVIKRYL